MTKANSLRKATNRDCHSRARQKSQLPVKAPQKARLKRLVTIVKQTSIRLFPNLKLSRRISVQVPIMMLRSSSRIHQVTASQS